MAPRKEKTAHDADAANEIYAVAKMESEQQLQAMRESIESIRVESQAHGALQAIETNIAFQELLKAVTLQRIKQNKEYKAGGMTWVDFCESLGLSWRTVDLMLEDLRPIMDTFSAKIADFSGMPFSKIRMLGKQVSANLAEIKDNCLLYGDESIPLTPEYRDDLQALIDRIGEESKEKIETLEADISAKDKVLKSKGDVITKMERELKKYERSAASKGLTTDEDAFLQLMFNKRTIFDGFMLSVDADFVLEHAGEVTPRMRAALLANLQYFRMLINVACDSATTNYGADLAPEQFEAFESWFQEHGAGTPQ